jgi:aspartyl-tRNA synthetase
MMAKRTHVCGELRRNHVGEHCVLFGWVNRDRDHGGLLFVDVRDRRGLVQTVFDPNLDRQLYERARELKPEYCVMVKGKVRPRPEGMQNPDLPTGEVEVLADELSVLNPSLTPPFVIVDAVKATEESRLRYRYLDLRRSLMQDNIETKHRLKQSFRKHLSKHGFLEIETPILTRSTPEGARDYLVPSRLHPGKFYCLAQSPQLYKQLLMVSGFDRYFQFARCLRDEDLRADRQPEHTQIDIEMSFVDEDDIFEIVEGMFKRAWREILGKRLKTPFPRMSYADSMNRYGTDKPDLRFGLELVDLTDETRDSGFRVFDDTVSKGGVVRGINAKKCKDFSRRELTELEEIAKQRGAAGLLWAKFDPFQGPLTKFLSDSVVGRLQKKGAVTSKDLLLMVAGEKATVDRSLGALRAEIGKRLGLTEKKEFAFCWVVDFPIFEYNAEEQRIEAAHHIFSMPKEEDIPLLDSEPLRVRGRVYDLVCNGVELASGSIRNHKSDLQQVLFRILNISEEEAIRRYGFLLEALKYGAPPHGGIAPGLDRICMLMVGRDNIRDVIPFPKTLQALALLEGAPSEVDEEQLKELHIRTVK